MAEITQGVRKKLDFRVGKSKKGCTDMHMQSSQNLLSAFKYDESLMDCQNVTYGYRGLLQPLVIYFSKSVPDEKRYEIYSLIESEKTMKEPQLQPDLTALAFTISVLCKVNIHLELGAPDLMYVYN